MKTIFNTILLIAVISLVSGNDEERYTSSELKLTKTEYLRTFKRFIAYVDENKFDFTKEQWAEMDERYKLYAHGYYDKYYKQLSEEERAFIFELRKLYHIIRSKRVAKVVFVRMENLWLEISSNL